MASPFPSHRRFGLIEGCYCPTCQVMRGDYTLATLNAELGYWRQIRRVTKA